MKEKTIEGKKELAWAFYQVLGTFYGIHGPARIMNWLYDVAHGESREISELFPIRPEERAKYEWHGNDACQPAPGWISVEDGLPEEDADVFAAIWWIDRTVPENSHYEIHNCSYYEGGEGSGQKIFADCEGEEFEAADVSFWIYKSDLAKQFAAPPEPAQEPKK